MTIQKLQFILGVNLLKLMLSSKDKKNSLILVLMIKQIEKHRCS